MFTIAFNDGSRFEGLTLNGNNFITTDDTVAAKLQATLGKATNIFRDVTITGDAADDQAGLIGTHDYMRVVQCVKYEGKWWFVLADLTAREIQDLEFDARLSFVEMMTEGM